jgi:hypothetical protein
MPRVRLLHWNAQEAAAHIEILRRARHRVDYEEQFRPGLMKDWRKSPPEAFVIDLSRLPSQGREIAISLRQSPSTRLIPIVFCGGRDAKVEELRKALPDAAYCTLPTLSLTLQTALRDPPTNPVKPPPMMERYQGRTAAQKLGIAASSTLRLIDPPASALKSLGELPPDVQVFEDGAEPAAVTLCFLHQSHSVRPVLSAVRHLAATGKLWILWRKGGSAARGDLTENLLRATAIDLGLVDYKICSVDPTWSAMLFARKKSPILFASQNKGATLFARQK